MSRITGTITVSNGNKNTDATVAPIDISGIEDHLLDGALTPCTVTNGGPQTLTTATATFGTPAPWRRYLPWNAAEQGDIVLAGTGIV